MYARDVGHGGHDDVLPEADFMVHTGEQIDGRAGLAVVVPGEHGRQFAIVDVLDDQGNMDRVPGIAVEKPKHDAGGKKRREGDQYGPTAILAKKIRQFNAVPNGHGGAQCPTNSQKRPGLPRR